MFSQICSLTANFQQTSKLYKNYTKGYIVTLFELNTGCTVTVMNLIFNKIVRICSYSCNIGLFSIITLYISGSFGLNVDTYRDAIFFSLFSFTFRRRSCFLDTLVNYLFGVVLIKQK